MRMKVMAVAFLASALILGVTAFEAYACEYCKMESRHQGLEEKFFCKAHLILSNQEELGLSDEQVDNIKELKMKAKKDLIRKDAEIEVAALDIKSEMYKKTIDTSAIGKLIDKKYDLKKEKAKSLVESYAALKGILTEEQKEKMKDMWKKCKEREKQGGMMCPMMSKSK